MNRKLQQIGYHLMNESQIAIDRALDEQIGRLPDGYAILNRFIQRRYAVRAILTHYRPYDNIIISMQVYP